MTNDTVEGLDLTRPISGIEHRTAREVFDIMADRIRLAWNTRPSDASALAPSTSAQVEGGAEVVVLPSAILALCDAEAEAWWSDGDVVAFVEAVRSEPTSERMEAFSRQCFVEGAYRGAAKVAGVRRAALASRASDGKAADRALIARAIADGFSNGNEQYDDATEAQRLRYDMAADAILALAPSPEERG